MAHSIETHLNAIKRPAYAIGRGELLLITTLWDDGDTVLLETAVRCYKAEEIQQIIDETVSDKCSVIGVDRYEIDTKKGESIAEDFDLRTYDERVEDEQAQEDAQELAQLRSRRRGTGIYSALNETPQGIAEVFKPRAGLNADLVRGANFR